MRKTEAFPIVISGPSGGGKTTLIKALVVADPLLRRSVSVTTRPPREGEVEGKSYFFVDTSKFESMKKDMLAEWAEIHDHLYGTPKRFLEEQIERGYDVILNIDFQGGTQVKKVFAGTVMVFILPPSLKVLRERMEKRGNNCDSEIEKRLQNAREEIETVGNYDYVVINDHLGEAILELQSIVGAERCRRFRYAEFLKGFTDPEE